MSSTPPLRILAIPGSLRRDSHNLAVLRAAADLAPATAIVTVYDRLSEIPVFNADLETPAGGPAGLIDIRAAISASDALLISTPEYNQSVPGVIKNLIDWLTRGKEGEGLSGLPVAITGATTGPWGTRIAQTQLRQMLASAGALVMPRPMLFIRHVNTLIDSTGEIADQGTRVLLADLVSALIDWTNLHSPVPLLVPPS